MINLSLGTYLCSFVLYWSNLRGSQILLSRGKDVLVSPGHNACRVWLLTVVSGTYLQWPRLTDISIFFIEEIWLHKHLQESYRITSHLNLSQYSLQISHFICRFRTPIVRSMTLPSILEDVYNFISNKFNCFRTLELTIFKIILWSRCCPCMNWGVPNHATSFELIITIDWHFFGNFGF